MSARHTDSEEIGKRAAEWILQRDRDEMTPQRCAELEAWLAADSRHRSEYLKLDELWKLSTGLKAWRPVDGREDSRVLLRARRAGSSFRWPLAIAASVLLVLAVGVVWFQDEAAQETYTTQVGGFERVTLEDGSVLLLNTDSQVRVRMSGQHREVTLDRGEVFFRVAHDAQRPFEVIADGTIVRAVGTAFLVRQRAAQRVEVVVAEGRVALRDQAPFGAGRGAPTDITAHQMVVAGETAEADGENIKVARVERTEVQRRLAWQIGQLQFVDKPLGDIVAEFNRYNRKQIRLEDPELVGIAVSGNFKANDLGSFVTAMQSSLHVRIESTPEEIRIVAP